MTSPNAAFTELVTSTMRNRSREVVDNVSDKNALLSYLKKKGHIKSQGYAGGTEIAIPLDYSENNTYQRYSGYDELDTSASDIITAASYNWAQAAIHVISSGRELRINNSKEAMFNLAKAKIKNAIRTAANNMSIDIYSSGALSNQIGGLGLLVQSDGTGTVGGINAGNHAFWANKYSEMAGTGTWSKTTIKGEMNKLWYDLVRGTDKPDLIVMSQDIYAAYEEALQDNQRYGEQKTASAGFETLKYKTADVIFDNNTNFGSTAETAYFLNTDYLFLIQHPEASWTQADDKMPVNQDAVVIPMFWMGQMATSQRSLQGKLIDAG